MQLIVVKSIPGVAVSVVTRYADGNQNNRGTVSGTANEAGVYVVGWFIEPFAALGEANVTATTEVGGQKESASASFTITQ